MTYKEWITATARRFTIGTVDIDMFLFNQRELIPDEDAEAEVKTAKYALCREFSSLIPLSDVTEGGYSVSWNWDAIKFWYEQTCTELGLDFSEKPKIRNRSNVW
jgi:hypothetical protein